MLIRIISAIIGLIVLVPLIIIGGVWLQIGLTIVVIMGMWEFYRAFEDIGIRHFLGFALAVVYIAFISVGDHFPDFWPLVFLPILMAVAYMAFVIMRRKSYKPNSSAIALLGFFYIAAPLSTIYLLREGQGLGMYHVWLVFISAWGCDTGAYFVGRTMGRHKLAPALSPKKTVEGSIGGTVSATLLGAIYGFILYNLGHLDFGYILIFALVAFVCSISGQIGDLAASSIKRSRNMKDFGSIMPGHGGMLDRFDSIIFTAPLAFVMLTLLERFMIIL